MAFMLTDVFERLGIKEDGRCVEEITSSEVANLSAFTPNDIKAKFPGVSFSQSEHVVYVPVKMCHSLPTINARGRCFTPHTLANSFASAKDGLINVDHLIRDNGLASSDKIVGHICAASFSVQDLSTEISDIASVPATPIPMYALAALYLRSPDAAKLIKDQQTGKTKWQTSMECGHSWRNAELLYQDEFIPIADADPRMLECIRHDRIERYKDRELAAVLGGRNGSVDFWGLAMTTAPADSGTEILGIYSGRNLELASKHNIFYAPIELRNFGNSLNSLEMATKAVDTAIKEIASIVVIGATDAHEDGHAHLVLSDLTILPTAGHSHYLNQFTLTRGSNPSVTGYTGEHCDYMSRPDGTERYVCHLHTINIPLKGKFSESTPEVDPEVASVLTSKEEEMWEKILAVLNAMEQRVSSGNPDEKGILKEVASLRREIESTNFEETVAKAVKAEIASQIEAGDLVPKEDAEKQVTEAVAQAEKEAAEKAEEERKATEAREARLKLVTDAAIDLDLEYEGIVIDGKVQTVRDHISSLPLDDNGELEFKRALALLKAAQTTQVEAVAAEAASKRRTVLNPVGAGSSNDAKPKGQGKSRFAKT